jgi:phosphotriesterase-related protein
VLGDIAPQALGFCQSHEHLSIARNCPVTGGLELCIDDAEKSAAELELYYAAGGRAITDAQPLGCGREADMLERISQNSGVHIIASTGFHKLAMYPESHWMHSSGEDDLTQLFISELDRGMYLDGDSRFPQRQGRAMAGQIKTAIDTEGLSPRYQKLFSAAAEAAKAADCALMAHIEQNTDPRPLAAFLAKQGLDGNRLIFCHLDRAIADINIHKEICQQGIYLEYDTIGRPKYHDDEKEAAIIYELVQSGYEKQLLLSLDTTRARLASYGGSPGLTHILKSFIPLLLAREFTEAHIKRFFIENPARVFARPAL